MADESARNGEPATIAALFIRIVGVPSCGFALVVSAYQSVDVVVK